jgi:hypothetical protein
MAATMLFPGIAAIKPFEAEEVVLHWNRLRAGEIPTRSPGRELFATTGVNMVGSVSFHLGQLTSIYRTSSVDWLFICGGGGGATEITAEKALNIRTMIFRFKSDASNASIRG